MDLLARLDQEHHDERRVPKAEPSFEPARLAFHIGSGMGPQTMLELRGDGRVHYEHTADGGWRREAVVVQPDSSGWRRLRRKLDRLALNRWHERYEQMVGTDGPEWALEVVYSDGLRCRSSGYWSFPPDGDTEPTREFNRLLTGLSELLGGRDVGGIRSTARPSRAARERLSEEVEELLSDGAALERALPDGVVEYRDKSQRSVNWVPVGELPPMPVMEMLAAAPWPTWDIAGHAPMRPHTGVVLVRVFAHPSELVTSVRGLERAEELFEHSVVEYRRTTGVPEDCAWFGTFVEVALRQTAVAEANNHEPVRGVLLGLASVDGADSATWRRAFSDVWRTLGLAHLSPEQAVLSYAVVERPEVDARGILLSPVSDR